MIEVWVLFILTHGGMRPIMEFNDPAKCEVYVEQYKRSHGSAVCEHLMRRDPGFRPEIYGRQK
jgi:hypothetical protein